MTEKIVVLSTCGSEEEAVRIAKHLVEGHLAACVNLIPRIRSFYRWQGKVEDSAEWMLVVKTSRDRFAALRDGTRSGAFLRIAGSSRAPDSRRFPQLSGLA